MMTYLFFDTETTGLPRNYNAPAEDVDNFPRIIQIAWIKTDLEGKQLIEKKHLIVPNGFSIPEDAVRIHGITTEKATKEGKELRIVLNEFLDDSRDAISLIAHNISYDEKVILAELIRGKISYDLSGKTKICTMKSSTVYVGIPGPYGYKFPKLDELHRFLFNQGFDKAHDALNDVRACVKCFFELKKRGIIK